MKIWFYKAEYGNFWDKLVAWWTGGPYSHVELCFSDMVCFSSSPRDNGTRFKSIQMAPHHWDVIDFPSESEEAIRLWCKTKVGLAYDWLGILGFAFKSISLEDQSKWYCSEIIMHVLNKFGDIDAPIRVHPNEMYKVLDIWR